MHRTGLALSLCGPEEKYVASRIEKYTDRPLPWSPLPRLETASGRPAKAPMVTLLVLGGKKAKLRPGDLLGARTGDGGLTRDQVGKTRITEPATNVAVDRNLASARFPAL